MASGLQLCSMTSTGKFPKLCCLLEYSIDIFNRLNLSFHDLYDTEGNGIFTILKLKITVEMFRSSDFIFSPDVNNILLDNKIFLNLRKDSHSQPLSLPLSRGTAINAQTDESIFEEKTTGISTSSCARYVAINQRISTGSDLDVRLEVFNVKLEGVSSLRNENITRLLRQCNGLQIDFHPFSPKLMLMLWDETDKSNELGNPYERVRCVIWELDTDRVLTIGEILDFAASFSKYCFV